MIKNYDINETIINIEIKQLEYIIKLMILTEYYKNKIT